MYTCEQCGKPTPNYYVMSVTCPACGMSNRIAWGSLMAESLGQAVSMLASSWNRR